MMRGRLAFVVAVATVIVAGCSATRGVSPTSVRTSLPTVTSPATTTTKPRPVTSPSTTGGRNVFGGDSPEDKRMPDVVCMNLQDAQNKIQDHGVFFSKSVDATGKGRRQLVDRNWIVVSQKPEPGEKVGEGTAVLSVVKTDEPNACK
jgi:hypothetical protein